MSAPAQARAMTVEQLIRLASEGRLRIPSFQRPLRWEPKDQRDLLDSIYRGYPVGTLLLWQDPPNGTEAGRPVNPDATVRTHGDHYLVVDGQQRVTTLWTALGRRPQPGEPAMVFDMEHEEFRIRPIKRDELESAEPVLPGTLPSVPLAVVLDAATLSEWVPQSLPRDVKRRYFDLGKRIREYQVGLYVVEEADVDVLRHVFDRINTSGKTMLREEVFDAIVGSQIGSADGASGLALVNGSLRDLGFGDLSSGAVLKALEAVRGDRIGKLDPRRLAVSQAAQDLVRTSRALRAAIEFLRDVGKIPHYSVCPYELPIIVLARFFALHPNTSERNLILLRRWLWRGALGERLSGASASLQQHVDDVEEASADASVQALLRRTGAPEQLPELDLQSPITLSSARGKVLVCALFDRQPRDLVTGDRLAVADVFRDGRDFLRPIVKSPHAAQGPASKLLHPGPGKPRQLIVECSDEAALASHGIDAETRELLRNGAIAEFERRRGRVLARWIASFFERLSEPERDDAPSISSLARSA